MLALSLAFAQSPPDSDNIGVPSLDADLVHRALATQRTLITEDAGRIREKPVGGFQLGFGYANAPLVVSWEGQNGRESVSVVRDILLVDLAATLEFDRLRVGLDVPIYPVATSDLGFSGSVLGNVAIDSRLTVLDPTEAVLGFGLIARVDLPSPGPEVAVASPRLGYELVATGERSFGDLAMAANLGWRGLPRTELYNVTWDDLLFARLGASYALTESGGVNLEGTIATIPAMFGAAPLGDPRGAPTPAEVLAGGWFAPVGGLALRGGVGTGLSPGIGSPRVRALIDVVWTPTVAPKDSDGDGVLDREDGCPEEAEDLDGFSDVDGCPDWDNDGDGLNDDEDACRDEPEDVDGFLDGDGCPDPRAKVLIRVVDDRDSPVNGAILQVSGDGLDATADKELDLHPGTYEVFAFAGGFQTSQSEFTVSDGRSQVIRVVLQRNPPGTARLAVRVPNGAVAPAGLALHIGDRTIRVVDGVAELELPPGTHSVDIDAFEPYGPWRGSISVRSDAVAELQIELAPKRVEVQGERIRLGGEITFNEAGGVDPSSYGVLGELTALLYSQQVLRVRIEGHTSTRGDAEANKALSLRQAEAVKRWLVAGGIEGSRLSAVGLGGSAPLEGRRDSANPRIELHLLR